VHPVAYCGQSGARDSRAWLEERKVAAQKKSQGPDAGDQVPRRVFSLRPTLVGKTGDAPHRRGTSLKHIL
jgi:hypothetical protein